MKEINLDSSAEGRVLEKDIPGRSGQVLAVAGIQLTGDIIKSLLSKGISRVFVRSCEDVSARETLSESEIDEIREECRKKLEQKFFKPPSGTMMKALFEAVLKDMVERQM